VSGITPERLAEIKARYEAATDGPWHGQHDEFGCVQIGNYGWVCGGANEPEYDIDSEQGHADAEFIAHARTDMPDLVAEVEFVHGQLVKQMRANVETFELNEELRAERDSARRWAVHLEQQVARIREIEQALRARTNHIEFGDGFERGQAAGLLIAVTALAAVLNAELGTDDEAGGQR
jgi:hypothetical protein